MNLPDGWALKALSNVCLPVEKVRPVDDPDREFTYIDISAIDRGALKITRPQRLTGRDAPSRARQQIRAGDVLISTVRPNLRKIARVDKHLDGEVASTGFCVLRPSNAITSGYLFWAVLSDGFQRRLIQKARGVSYPAVRDSDVLEELVPIPPQGEQHRIAAAIERIYAGLESSNRSVEMGMKAVEAFKLSVFDAAFHGHLCGERRDAPRSSPPGWRLVHLEEVAEHSLGKMLDKAKNQGKNRPYLRNLNVQWGSFVLDDIKEMRIAEKEKARYGVRRGDLLVCEGGEPGRCAVWDSDQEIFFQKALHRVRPSPEANVHFLAHYLRFAALTQRLDPLFTGSTIKHLPGVKLGQLRIPLPPRDEQDRIVQVIDAQLEHADRAEQTLIGSVRDSDALKKAVLGRAISGQL